MIEIWGGDMILNYKVFKDVGDLIASTVAEKWKDGDKTDWNSQINSFRIVLNKIRNGLPGLDKHITDVYIKQFMKKAVAVSEDDKNLMLYVDVDKRMPEILNRMVALSQFLGTHESSRVGVVEGEKLSRTFNYMRRLEGSEFNFDYEREIASMVSELALVEFALSKNLSTEHEGM